MNWPTSAVADHYRRLGVPNPIQEACGDGRSKYGVSPKEERIWDGITFASKAEMLVYRQLKVEKEIGAITDLELQPRFLLQAAFVDEAGKKHRKMEYVADFRFQRDGKTVVVDVKSKPTMTPAFRMKWKLVIARYPGITWEMWK